MNTMSALEHVERWIRKDKLLRHMLPTGDVGVYVSKPDFKAEHNFSIRVTTKLHRFDISPSHKASVTEIQNSDHGPDHEFVGKDGEPVDWKVTVVGPNPTQHVVAIDEYATLSDAVLYLVEVYGYSDDVDEQASQAYLEYK